MNKTVEILVISDTKDFATDYVIANLEERGESYLRLNRDLLSTYIIKYDINNNILKINIEDNVFTVSNNTLKTVYYRAPTFLRESFLANTSIHNQLEKSQWMAFIRNLISFDNAKWMNNPVDTYRCENKIYQLQKAKKCGLSIPKTLVANSNIINEFDYCIAKSIDTAILKDNDDELFFYSNVINKKELSKYDNSIAPLFYQEYLKDKIDIRVTVVGSYIYACEIRSIDGSVIVDDWRKKKNEVVYVPVNLPDSVKAKLFKLMNILDISFGGIDLIKCNNIYYFIEVNPTGEWAWLMNKTDCSIDKEITKWLCKK